MPEEKKDKKPSLSERLKAEQKEEKAPSLADRMKARRVEEEEKAPSLADRMKSRREQEKATGLAQKMKDRMSAFTSDKPQETPADIAKQIEAAMNLQLAGVASAAVLTAEETEALKTTLDTQRKQFESLIKRVRLTDIVRQVTQTGTQIEGLPNAIGKLRARGYIFHSYLEDKVEVLATQWDGIQGKINEWVEREADILSSELDKAEAIFTRIDEDPAITASDRRDSARVGSLMSILEKKIEAAEEQIKLLFDALKRETDNTARQIRDIDAVLAMKDEASFDFKAGENLFMAAKAEWVDGGEKPNGILYLTDQRLAFEQKETTGKTFGLFGGKKVQDILWEVPMTLLEKVESENKGFLGGKDMLYLTFGAGAPYGQITVELKGGVSNKLWETQLKRMMRGELESESIAAPDDNFIERLRNTPTDCPTCGATLSPITGTPTQIDCIYCGTAIRI